MGEEDPDGAARGERLAATAGGGWRGGRAAVGGGGALRPRAAAEEGGSDAAGGSAATVGGFLVEAVLSWTIDEILEDPKVNVLPSHFSSFHQYLDVYSNHLLEKTREKLHTQVSQIANCQHYYRVLSYAGLYSEYYIDIDLSNLGCCSHIAHDGDIFFLTSQLPKQNDNLSGQFGIAIGIGRDTFFQRSFRVLIRENHKEIDCGEIKYVSFLTNIMDDINISRSIASIELQQTPIIKTMIEYNEKVGSKCSMCLEPCVFESFIHSNDYNKQQSDAIRNIFSDLKCAHHDSIQLVWGPPGTGKTRVVIAVMKLMMELRVRVLLCVPSEKCIPEFLHNFKELFPDSNFKSMVVLANLEDMENYSEVSLENMAQDVYCSIYLWTSWLKELAFVLRLKPYCMDNCDHQEYTVCTKSKLLVFPFTSFQKKVHTLAVDVKKCSACLLSRFPECDVENIYKLISHLSQFESLMQNQDISVERAFGLKSDFHLTLEEIELNEMRMNCIGLIEGLLTSIELPQLKDRNEIEEFCIRGSSIIISTPLCTSRLNEMKLDSVDVLIVDEAAQISESDLLIPLSMSPKHVLLLGDHLHLQPTVCSEASYGSSLFHRLLQLYPEKKIVLNKQYMMDPSISQFVNEHFYENKIENSWTGMSHEYSKQLIESGIAPYGFFDISNVVELRQKGKYFVECAAVMFLLQILSKGPTNANGKVNVGVVCVRSQIEALRTRLGTIYESNDRMNVEVHSLDNMQRSWYDLVILSSIIDDASELPEGNIVNVALTTARHSLFIIGEATSLADGGVWEKLYKDAKGRHSNAKLTNEVLAKVIKRLKWNDAGPPTANSALPNNIMSQPGQEYTWAGRPHNTKCILAPLRDQKGAPDTCTFQASLGTTESENKFQCSCMDPPQDFMWNLSLDNLKSQYEHLVSEELSSEEKSKRGKHRLQTALDILKDHGVIGHNRVHSEEERLFKIASYEQVAVDEPNNIRSLLKAGNIMIGSFRVSRNYFYLKPGESYSYDKNMPYIHPKSNLPASHAVMVIGNGHGPIASTQGTSKTLYDCHVNIQNSEGKRFGLDGLGRVLTCSLRGLFKISLPDKS